MNAKQEAELYIAGVDLEDHIEELLKGLLKELEAADKVVEAAEKLTGQQLYGNKAFSKYWRELKEALLTKQELQVFIDNAPEQRDSDE